MAVQADTLLEPKGPLTTTLFPNEDRGALLVRADAYLERADADGRVKGLDPAVIDQGTTALALHFAFSDVVIRMSSEPLTVNVAEKGSHGYSTAQIETMKQLRDGYLNDLEDLIETNDATVISPGTTAIPNRFTW